MPATQVGVHVFQVTMPVPTAVAAPQLVHEIPVINRLASAQLMTIDFGATFKVPQSLIRTGVAADAGDAAGSSRPHVLRRVAANGTRRRLVILNLYHEVAGSAVWPLGVVTLG